MLAGPLHRRPRPEAGGRLPALALAVLASAFSGCILPLAPEFQAVENEHPFVVRAVPRVGSEVQTEDMVFEVTVQDRNHDDRLHARWLIDYPRSDQPARMPGRQDVLPAPDDPNVLNEQTVRFKPDCLEHAISNVTTQHRLMLVVSDRPFIEETDLRLPNFWDSTPSSAGVVSTFWWFRKVCR